MPQGIVNQEIDISLGIGQQGILREPYFPSDFVLVQLTRLNDDDVFRIIAGNQRAESGKRPFLAVLDQIDLVAIRRFQQRAAGPENLLVKPAVPDFPEVVVSADLVAVNHRAASVGVIGVQSGRNLVLGDNQLVILSFPGIADAPLGKGAEEILLVQALDVQVS